MRRWLFVLSLMMVSVFAAKKERDWQTGTLLDADRSRIYLGTYTQTQANANTRTTGTLNTHGPYGTYSGQGTTEAQATTTSTPRYALQSVYLIESPQYTYVVERILKFRWNKEARLVVNGPVRFAVEKGTMYLLDEDGREHKSKIVRQVLKRSSTSELTSRP